MRSIISMGILVTAGALAMFTLAGCSEAEVAERPADEPVRSAADVGETISEEEARAAEEAAQNQNP